MDTFEINELMELGSNPELEEQYGPIMQTTPFIRVWDAGDEYCDRYTVVFYSGDAYTMSHYANRPNGMCQHFGIIQDTTGLGERLEWNDLPKGVQYQINAILAEIYEIRT